MKATNFVALFLVMIGFCACGNKSNTVKGQDQGGSGQSVDDSSLCQGGCEGVAYAKRGNSSDSGWNALTLRPEETASLKHTMETTRVNGTVDKTHIHADAVNGQLVFSSDSAQDPTHVSGGEPEVSFGGGKPGTTSLAVRVVATPAAAKILQQRSTQP